MNCKKRPLAKIVSVSTDGEEKTIEYKSETGYHALVKFGKSGVLPTVLDTGTEVETIGDQVFPVPHTYETYVSSNQEIAEPAKTKEDYINILKSGEGSVTFDLSVE